jgi:hypothetical protein
MSKAIKKKSNKTGRTTTIPPSKKNKKKTTGKLSKKDSNKPAKKISEKTATSKARKINPDFEEKTSLDTAYLINGSDAAVTLEIILGAPGQTGTTDIILDGVNIITGEKGSLPEFALGSNRKLHGKTMRITTVISDTAKDTNYLESIIRIRGGIRFAEYVLYKTLEKEGGFAIFTSSIEFFKI